MDISPDKQNIDRVFSNTSYHIDFYQRDFVGRSSQFFVYWMMYSQN